MELTNNQLKTLSNFCNDIAKGLFLYSLIGQGVVINDKLLPRPAGIALGIGLSLFFLYFAIFLNKGGKNDNG